MLKIRFRLYFLAAAAAVLALGCSLLGAKTATPQSGDGAVNATAPIATTDAPTTPASTLAPAAAEMPVATQTAEGLPPDNCPQNLGRITFTYDQVGKSNSNGYEIYVMNADGSGQTRLTTNEVYDSHPAWSPGRCRIAYTSYNHDGDNDIYVMNADGSNQTQLTNDPARDMFPEWSPDGKQIAFVSYRDGFRNLFIMNPDGSNQRQVTKNNGDYSQWPSWAPSGDEIAFTYQPAGPQDKEQGVYAIHPDGSGQRKLIPSSGDSSDSEPAWSPDGKTLFFISNRSSQTEIWRINPDGSSPRQVSNTSSVNVTPSHSLHVSPDGKKLIFYGVGPGSEQFGEEVYVINIDGSGMKTITHTPDNDQWPNW